ncbi:MAG: PAS domain-containing sensor histidine kinase [Nitrospirae bacterium]|nr:PAS domain-containing sensor histidine kinase [Nitrospirota bacterium]MBF0534835.1 PAS domain-containing sensor histidine kinase [Nitrospirota bacterium]MBF0616750.1 PAS domain-containing sensor histidine kinase [Nitrospirota bacterium]
MNDNQIQADILGKMLVIQESLDVMPTMEGMVGFLGHALIEIPGVSHLLLCINGTVYDSLHDRFFKCGDCDFSDHSSLKKCNFTVSQNDRVVTLKDKERFMGVFLSKLHNLEQYIPYEPFIKNIAGVVVKTVQNREYLQTICVTNKELSESSAKLIESQRIAHIGSWEYDIDKDRVLWSDEAYAIYGMEKKETSLSYNDLKNIIHPDDRDFHNNNVKHWITDKGGHPFEYRIIRRNGETRYIYTIGQVKYSSNGTVKVLYGTIQDVTEMKEMREALQDSRQRLSAVLSASRIGTWRWMVDSGEDTRDENLNAILGLIPRETTQPVNDFIQRIHPGDREKVEEAIRSAMVNKVKFSLECRIILPEGTECWILYVGVPFMNDRGDIISMAGACIDITEKKAAEQDGRRQEQILIQQSKLAAMGELLINISHHWRQPLCAIGVSIQEIKDAYIHDELDEAYMIKIIEESMSELNNLSATIDNLRNFYIQKKELTEFNIADKINRAKSLLSGYIKEKGIVIDNELDESLTIQGYPNEFANVILNILTNAKDKFEQNNIINGIIKIKLNKDATTNRVIISVSDNGGEIPDDIINKVFEPYFTTKDRSQGVGLGLYMAKVIIEKNMKGTITVRNMDGWCEFRIEI